jgi:C4-dicarboxylate-binding protein DctP
MLNRRKFVATAAASAAIIGSGSARAQGSFNFRIGAGHPSAALVYVNAGETFFAPEVTKRAKERLNIDVTWTHAYAGSVAKLNEVLDFTKNGLLDFGLVAFPFEPTKLFLHNWQYWIPFNSSDPMQVTRVTRQVYERFPYLTQTLERQHNQRFLGIATTDSYNLGTKFPWEKLEDLRGKKIGAAGPNLPLLRNTGAVPVQANLNDMYNGLQTGIYDGIIMFPSSYAGFKFSEVAPHYKMLGMGCVSVSALTVNNDVFKRMPKGLQDIVLEVGREYEIRAAQLNIEREKSGLEQIEKAGGKVTRLGEEARRAWAEGVASLPNENAKEADKRGMPGSDVVRAYLQALAADGYRTPVEYKIA